MSAHNKVPARTPSQALRIADFDFLNQSRSKETRPTIHTRHSINPQASRAKRIVDLFTDMMPPPSTNTTSTKRAARNYTQVQKNFMSTSKKQLHNRKTDHAVVRRALNFIGNQTEDVQIHPKSKPIMQKFSEYNKCKPEDNNSKVHSVVSQNKNLAINIKMESTTNSSKAVKPRTSTLNNTHKYDLRSYKSIETKQNILNKSSDKYTKYRNVNESFDVSVCEENSPTVKLLEKTLVECSQVCKQSDMSDSLCSMLQKTDISSPDLTQNIITLQSKIQENYSIINAQIEFLDHITKEIENNKKKLTTCVENNKQMLELTSDLLNAVQAKEKPNMKKRRSSIPLSRKSVTQSIVNQILHKEYVLENNDTFQSRPSEHEGDCGATDITKSSVVKISNLSSENKENNKSEHIYKTNINRSDNDLRRVVLLTTFESNKNLIKQENINQSDPKVVSLSPRIVTRASLKVDCSPKPNLLKPFTPKSMLLSSKVQGSPKSNTFKVDSPKTSKSLQIYKSLKDSVRFLKTPVGKKSFLSDITYETPNTRSRNITSNNLKRQLETLYDS